MFTESTEKTDIANRACPSQTENNIRSGHHCETRHRRSGLLLDELGLHKVVPGKCKHFTERRNSNRLRYIQGLNFFLDFSAQKGRT